MGTTTSIPGGGGDLRSQCLLPRKRLKHQVPPPISSARMEVPFSGTSENELCITVVLTVSWVAPKAVLGAELREDALGVEL